ncbi:MAG: hypothetical protein HUJ25_04925, partial [Crocinitomicaceae bacterium]|nr:hypothetical protein [Crocinitomicaceae bacterium]
NILEEIEQVNDALYIIEVQMKERQNEVEGEWMSAVQTLESSLKIYKNNLIHKLEEIDDQTDEDWAEFKDNTKVWWDKIREGIDEAFSAAEQEYAELTE